MPQDEVGTFRIARGGRGRVGSGRLTGFLARKGWRGNVPKNTGIVSSVCTHVVVELGEHLINLSLVVLVSRCLVHNARGSISLATIGYKTV